MSKKIVSTGKGTLSRTRTEYKMRIKGSFYHKSFEKALQQFGKKAETNLLKNFILDLSETSWVEIASITFLLCFLNKLKRNGINVRIVLPEDNLSLFENRDTAKKVRDFLFRWKFYDCLQLYVDPLLENLFYSNQMHLLKEAQVFYTPAHLSRADDMFTQLLSNGLLELTPLTEIRGGQSSISADIINSRIELLTKSALIKTILKNAIGLSDAGAEAFGKTLICESLKNVYEHPEATVGIIGMAKDIGGKWFLIAVADNGVTIPETIKKTFISDKKIQALGDKDLLAIACEDHTLIEYATRENVTSKPHLPGINRGMGLHFLKTKSIELGGYLAIRSGSARVKFLKKDSAIDCQLEDVPRQDGNLITIYLPYKKGAMKR
jgi:ABC-type transporter Mla MlaB component